jgi:arylsulfatase A-like enzyme/Flp pilus assembly protein TadD
MMRGPAARAVLIVGVILAAAGAVWFAPRPRSSTPRLELRGANVLLVTIDTLRTNRIGAYGSSAGLTPALDALAAGGVRFTHVWSHAPITLPAHASILTGLVPPHHRVRNNGAFRLGAEPSTLAERLRQAGYRTGAFVGAFVLDRRFGLDRGFDEYDDRYRASAETGFHFAERPADEVLRAATGWITQPGAGDSRPWFAWIHLFDPHAPYRAPAAFAANRLPYEAEVAWTDSALGSALDSLRGGGQLARTIVIVTADHGESLGDHGETTHGLFAYDATLRVPLIVSAPGLAPRVVATAASHADIAPTVLDLVAGAEASVDGRSLRAALEGTQEAADAPAYFETLDANLTRGWAPLTGIVAANWKYIDLPEPELYHLDADPEERTNLASHEPERVRAMQSQLQGWAAKPAATDARPVDAAAAARLRSLGYLATAAPTRDAYTVADDPKRLVALSETFNDALDDYSRGRADVAVDKLTKVLEARPDFLAARLSAATALIATRRAADAIALLRQASSHDQSTPSWKTRMGQALAAAGHLPEARTLLEAAAGAEPGASESLNELGVVLVRLGRVDEARAAFKRLLDADPTATGTWYNLGLLELGAHRGAEAAAAFTHVVELDPAHADGWRGLAAAVAPGDRTRAISAWQRVIAIDPRDFDTLYNLGMLLAESGDRAAVPYLQRFVAEAPRDRYARDLPQVRAVLARMERP